MDQFSDSSEEFPNRPFKFSLVYGVGGSPEVTFALNFWNLSDSDSDDVSWVESAFRRVGFFWSRVAGAGIAFFGTAVLLFRRFLPVAFAGVVVAVFCDASCRLRRLGLPLCLGSPGCLGLGGAAFLSGRGRCVFANFAIKSAFLGFR